MRSNRNAYWALSLVAVVTTATGVIYLSLAPTAGAFWPFSVSRAAGDTAMIHNPGQVELLSSTLSNAQGGADIAVSGGSALMANTGPGGSVSYVESRPAKGAITTYAVKEGDSLSEIASSHGVSTNTVLWANDISDASLIKPGMELIILPVSGIQYKVKSGDTLGSIAKKYSGEAGDIASYNGLSVGAALTEGTVLIIPGGELAEAPAKKAAVSSSSSKKASPKAARALPALSGYFGNPLPGGKLSQGIHGYNGVDIAAPSGTPIYAAAAGSVIVAKNGGYNGGYGSYVVISHGNGTQTLYAHMSSVAAGGGAVEKGALIGYVGNTGKSTGNHLHFEVRGAKNPYAN
ncbi:MAG TPA: M23 family metallopeptidase [Candidatus Paceibacterota bacterium]|nr:M23 family metallopeptidase [Candidatus Paceibacterota bacterium]